MTLLFSRLGCVPVCMTIPLSLSIITHNCPVTSTPVQQTTTFHGQNTIMVTCGNSKPVERSCHVYLAETKSIEKASQPPTAFLCCTWTQWTSPEFIGTEDHPHPFQFCFSLPPVPPSPSFVVLIFFSLPVIVLAALEFNYSHGFKFKLMEMYCCCTTSQWVWTGPKHKNKPSPVELFMVQMKLRRTWIYQHALTSELKHNNMV